MEQIQAQFDRLIDEVSNRRDQILTRIKYCYFSSTQLKFIDIVQNQNFDELTGFNFKNILNCFEAKDQPSFLKNRVKQTLTEVQRLFLSIQESLLKFRDTFAFSSFLSLDNIKRLSKRFQNDTWNSKILTTEEQLKILQSLISSKPFNTLKLLYRASQNNFEVNKFYELCQDISPTLLLIKTSKKKILGGYSRVPWKRYNQTKQLADPSGQTFIFSLTHNKKFVMKNYEFATFYFNEHWGPLFGKVNQPDLAVYNKANQSSRGNWVFRCRNFYNENHFNNSLQIYKNFTGSQTEDFQIIEWEVFQINF